MKPYISQYATRPLRRFLQPKAILFGIVILHLVVMLVYVGHYEQQFPVVSDHWNPARLMQEPVLLFFAAAALLVGKPWSYLIAIVIGGRVVYVIGYLGLIATSSAYDSSVLSWLVLKTWMGIMYSAQPQYLVELLLATIIGTYASKLLLSNLRKRTP